MLKNLVSYASYFVSYILNNLEDINKINKIILFGSAARGESNKDSDIDIFIDVNKSTNVFEKKINKVKEEFYRSREGLIFKNKGIDNRINLIVGKIEKWADLKKSIESTGIVFYGRYVPSGVKKGLGGQKYAFFYWDKIGKNRGAFLNKIYGFKIKHKRYKGLIEEYGGMKLGKSSIMMPIHYRSKIESLLKKYKVNSKVIEIYY